MEPRPATFLDAAHIRLRGRTLLYFGGCNYLGLSWNSSVRRALAAAAKHGPLQPGASRATTGEQGAYRGFERRLAQFFRVGGAAFVSTGYLAPIAACQTLSKEITHVLLDGGAHPCVADGARLTGRPVFRFRQGNLADLKRTIAKLPRRACPLIACDGVLGACGGISPLDAYLAALPPSGLLLVDDAHGAGVVGPGGRGAVAEFGLCSSRVVQTISLAKAFGVAGGAVLGSAELAAAVRSRAAACVGSTSPLLPVAAALEASLEIVRRNPQLVGRLQSRARLLHEQVQEIGRITGDPRTPVVAFSPASIEEAERLRRALLRADIFPPFIRYYGGPASGFFRFAVCAVHRPREIRLLARTIRIGVKSQH
jgi:7-keto-8-aminopelargonate synthetase-like enzyme